ncbi:YlmC/YmxH family sporulation protein [Aneurinibacillus uraniidurans]|uniref:YlmC/YmxH family sporulation protein n=1 Tax=Aneurinibacillus uraniidurans TaxID=2966586 RepID=UPI00234A0254|nr:YlmC/YmxH family sporulation protein [Aneurinibacillus sp. B1]WCN39152.1 YlmC/YmxH family sporulation protein [Aneurinibacillus sp. B1]
MRYSELGGKEIINLDNGERMGVVGQSDLVIDSKTGSIESIIVPHTGMLKIGRKKDDVMIPWKSIRKIGSEMIIVEQMEEGEER